MNSTNYSVVETTTSIASTSVVATTAPIGGVAHFISNLYIYLPYVLFSGFGVIIGITGTGHIA